MRMSGASDRVGEWLQGLWWGQAARQTTVGGGRVLGCSQCWEGGG